MEIKKTTPLAPGLGVLDFHSFFVFVLKMVDVVQGRELTKCTDNHNSCNYVNYYHKHTLNGCEHHGGRGPELPQTVNIQISPLLTRGVQVCWNALLDIHA